MKRYWSTLSGLPVMAGEEEKSLGSLRGVFLNPENGKLIGFLVGFGKIVTPFEIQKWGREQVMVRDTESLVPFTEILRLDEFGLRRSLFNGKKVISKSGKRLGRVRDFSLDREALGLADFEVSKRFLGIEWRKRLFSYKDIEEITGGAVVVNAELEEKKVPLKAQMPFVT